MKFGDLLDAGRPAVYKLMSTFISRHLPTNILLNKCYDLTALHKKSYSRNTNYPAILFPKFGFKHGSLNRPKPVHAY